MWPLESEQGKDINVHPEMAARIISETARLGVASRTREPSTFLCARSVEVREHVCPVDTDPRSADDDYLARQPLSDSRGVVQQDGIANDGDPGAARPRAAHPPGLGRLCRPKTRLQDLVKTQRRAAWLASSSFVVVKSAIG